MCTEIETIVHSGWHRCNNRDRYSPNYFRNANLRLILLKLTGGLLSKPTSAAESQAQYNGSRANAWSLTMLRINFANSCSFCPRQDFPSSNESTKLALIAFLFSTFNFATSKNV